MESISSASSQSKDIEPFEISVRAQEIRTGERIREIKEVLALVFVPLMFVLPYAFGYKKQRDVPTMVFYLLFFYSVGKFLYPLTFLTAE